MQEKTFSPLMSPRVQADAYLMIETGSRAGQRFDLSTVNRSLLLGRAPECDLLFDQQESVVGRKHARIDVRPDGVYLVDLHSVNGTFLGDSAVEGEVLLHDGDRFLLGGEGGPWLSVQLPAVMHRMRPAVAPGPAFATPIAVPLAERQEERVLERPAPAPMRSISPTPEPVSWRQPPPAQTREGSPSTSCPQAAQHQIPPRLAEPQYIAPATPLKVGLARYPMLRQVLLFSLILSLACVIGVLLGLRNIL